MEHLTIKVKVIKAILTHNTEIGSQMDPFVVLKLGTNQQRGKTLDEAGDMPVFNQQFTFPYQGHSTMFHLIVYDEDVTIDDIVGQVQIDLKPIILQQFTPKKWYSLKYNGKIPAGKIMLEFQCNRGQLTVSENIQLNKELIKANIHHIGVVSSAQRKVEIHRLRPKQLNHQHKRLTPLPNDKPPQYNSPKFLFSFRDNSWHKKQLTNIQSQYLHPICVKPSYSTLHSQGSVYDSVSVRSHNNEIRNHNQMNGMTTFHVLSTSQMHHSQTSTSHTYYSTRQNIPSITYPNPSSHNNFFIVNHY